MGDVSHAGRRPSERSMPAPTSSAPLWPATRITRSEQRGPAFDLMEEFARAGLPFVAEGRIWSPQEAFRCFQLGARFIVVGSAITRPDAITRRFAERSRRRERPSALKRNPVMIKRRRVAVIGAGFMGSMHAAIFSDWWAPNSRRSSTRTGELAEARGGEGAAAARSMRATRSCWQHGARSRPGHDLHARQPASGAGALPWQQSRHQPLRRKADRLERRGRQGHHPPPARRPGQAWRRLSACASTRATPAPRT